MRYSDQIQWYNDPDLEAKIQYLIEEIPLESLEYAYHELKKINVGLNDTRIHLGWGMYIRGLLYRGEIEGKFKSQPFVHPDSAWKDIIIEVFNRTCGDHFKHEQQ